MVCVLGIALIYLTKVFYERKSHFLNDQVWIRDDFYKV